MSVLTKHIQYLIRILLLLILCASTNAAFAQVYDTVVVPKVDSTLIGATTEEDSTIEESEEPQVEPLPDTASLRMVDQTFVDSLKRSKEFEYANDPRYWVRNNSEKADTDFIEKLFGFGTMKSIMYVLISALIVFIVFKLIDNNNLFYRSKGKSLSLNTGEDELMEETDIQSKIDQSIREKDFRKAVRYSFVQMLQNMDQYGWIKYHSKATNHDYQLQLLNAPFYNDFQFLLQVYEYVWYGEFDISEQQFLSIQPKFRSILKRTGS